VQYEIKKRKKNISKFNHFRYATTLITVHSTVFAELCSSKFMGRCLGISMNSKSDWLKSEAEHYQQSAINERRMHLPACAYTNGRYLE